MKRRPAYAHHVVPVRVKGHPYDIIVGRRMTSHLGPALRRLGVGTDVVIITDRNIAQWYLDPLVRHLERNNFRTIPIVLPHGETQKSLERASKIYSTMIGNGVGRHSAVLALGGGVIGDLSGFVAATYQRGITLIQVPTTLLSQVDSSIGGKVAVNHRLGKNMIGAFHQPTVVWTDVACLRTLPKREISCGLGEIIKYGVIRDATLFNWLEENVEAVIRKKENALLHVQATCSSAKAVICSRDERETGLRVILNFGHTVGHALEAAGGYRSIKHGEGVLLGMKAETWIAREMGLITAPVYDRIFALVNRVPLFCTTRGLRASSIMSAMKRDKKSRSGKKRFVLPRRIGKVEVVEGVNNDLIAESLRVIL